MTLTPAYGRDYKTAKAAVEDFNSGKDFIIADFFSQWDGKPANREDLVRAGEKSVVIRYYKLTKLVNVKL